MAICLIQARQEAGLSQKQLGIAAGIDEFVASPRMNQYETGKHTPDFVVLQQIAKVLKVSVAYFYAVDNDLALLAKGYARLSAQKKRQLIECLDELMGPIV